MSHRNSPSAAASPAAASGLTRSYRVYRDAYVIAEVDVDAQGCVAGQPSVWLQTYDDYQVIEVKLDGGEIENAEFPAGVSWPEGMPYAAGAEVGLELNP